MVSIRLKKAQSLRLAAAKKLENQKTKVITKKRTTKKKTASKKERVSKANKKTKVSARRTSKRATAASTSSSKQKKVKKPVEKKKSRGKPKKSQPMEKTSVSRSSLSQKIKFLGIADILKSCDKNEGDNISRFNNSSKVSNESDYANFTSKNNKNFLRIC